MGSPFPAGGGARKKAGLGPAQRDGPRGITGPRPSTSPGGSTGGSRRPLTGPTARHARGRRPLLPRWTSQILIVIAVIYLPAVGSLPAYQSPGDDTSLSSSTNRQGVQLFVDAPEAMALLGSRNRNSGGGDRKRVKRGWSINSLNLLWEMEEQQRRDAAKLHQKELHLAKVCPKTCWGRLGPWSECSVSCGSSGVQFAHRNITPPTECASWVRQHGCPGSSRLNRPCNRKCFNGGTLREADCACPAGFNGTCCKSLITCGDPGTPPNGYLRNFFFVFNATVRYNCRYGYRLYGDVTRRCKDDGRWSGDMPICSIVTCERPARLENGWIELRNGSTFGSDAVYACVAGYSLEGHRKRRCQHTGHWSGPEARCQKIYCPPLPVPEAGILRLPSSRSGLTPYGGVAIYSCNYTHTIRGERIRRCEGPGPIGIWTGHEPKCVEKSRCPSPKAPSSNTELHCSADVETGGELCRVVCARGFAREMDAEEYIECNDDTLWTWARPNNSSPLAECIETLTPRITLQAEAPYSVSDCAALRPQERSLLRAEFSHILAVHDICMQGMPGHYGCHVTEVESHCNDWQSRRSAPYRFVSTELVMTFNLSVASVPLRDVACREFCSNVTDVVCNTVSCLDGYVKRSIGLLIENVEQLRLLTRVGARGDMIDRQDDIPKENDVTAFGETSAFDDKPTMAAGRFVLFAKDNVKISDVTIICDDSTFAGRKYCQSD